MSRTRDHWSALRAAAVERDAERVAGAVVRPLKGLVQIDAIHVLSSERLDPFWRTMPPAEPAGAPGPVTGPRPPRRIPRDPWSTLPESVRILRPFDGYRVARVAERICMGGTRAFAERMVQRLHATPRPSEAAPGSDFHADLRTCAEETRAWALEASADAGLDPAIWRLTIEIVDAWSLAGAETSGLPFAPNARPDPDPVFESLAAVGDQQYFLNRAECRRVLAAMAAWRIVQDEQGVEGTTNSPYENGFFADLGLSLGVSGGTAKSMVHIADRLARLLPAVWAMFLAGAVPWKAMQAAHAAIDGIQDDDVLALFDTEAAALLGETPTVQVYDALRRLAERLQPTTLDDRLARAMQRRHIRIEPAKDGMGWLTGFLPMVQLAGIDDQLTKAAIAEHKRANGTTGGITVLRADVFCDGLIDALGRDAEPMVEPATDDTEPSGPAASAEAKRVPLVPDRGGIRPHVGILIPAMSALGHADAPATLEGYGPIGIKTALRLAGEATSWVRVLTDQFTGAIITVGREKYRPTADMRALLRMIDGGGRGPGCTRPPSQTEVDHNESFWKGGERGETSVRNLVLLSHADHAGKTDGEIDAKLLRDRTLLWGTRAGNRYVTRPHDPPRPTPIPPELIDPDEADDCPFWTDRSA